MRLTRWLIGLGVVIGLVALYFAVAVSWSYSSGERAVSPSTPIWS